MAEIQFSREHTQILVQKLQTYFTKELELDIGEFDAEFLLDFFSKELGNYYYNKGLTDAQAVLTEKMDGIADGIYELERPTDD